MDEGFEDFVVARLTALVAFARRLTGDPASADDLVQEALLRAGVRWRAIQRRDHPDVYVRTVITRLFIDGWHRARREVPVESVAEGPAPVADLDAAMDIRTALLTLAPRQRAVLVLRYYLDLSEAQIAETMNVSRGTVKRTSSDALHRLEQRLAGDPRLPETAPRDA